MRKAVIVLCAVLLCYAAKQVAVPSFTDDDAFFLDVSSHLVNQHRMAADVYGSVLGVDTFVAGMPIAYPLVVALDVYAFQAAHSVRVVKLSCLLLLALFGVLVLRALVRAGVGRAAWWLMLLVLTDGYASHPFDSLRYDGWLIIVMTATYLAMRRVLEEASWANVLWLGGALLLCVFSHWQLASTVLAVLLSLVLFGEGRRVSWAQLGMLVAAIGAAYGGYIEWILRDPGRRAAAHLQFVDARAFSGQPPGLDLATKAKVLVGNFFYSNFEHSVFSVLLLVLLLSLALRVLRTGWRTPPGVWSDVLFIGAGLAPALALDYVGARWIPLYAVVILMLVRHADPGDWNWRGWKLAGVLLANALGYALMRHYLHLSWSELLGGQATLLLGTYAVCRWLVPSAARIPVLVTALLVMNVTANFGVTSMLAQRSSPVTPASVAQISEALARIMPDAFDARRAAPVEIFCDPSVCLLPIKLLDADHRTVVRGLFPLLYLKSPEAQSRFMSAFHPEFVLLSDRYRGQLLEYRQAGDPFFAELNNRYRPLGRIEAAGVGMDVYRRVAGTN